jgi:hypothetical protein
LFLTLTIERFWVINENELLKNISNFRGVITIDTLPKKIFKSECGVINYDRISGPGTHWVCYYNHPKSKFSEVMDSLGLPPPKEILNYLETSGKDFLYNSSQIQANDSVLCGYYCVNYIIKRSKNISPYDILYKFFEFFPVN